MAAPRRITMNTTKITYALAAVFLFMAGYHTHSYFHTCPTPEPEVITKYQDKIKTEIVYVPKEHGEKTDVDLQLGKPELNVMVNDKPFTIQKEHDEQYVFDKNKLSLTQTSRSDLHISIPTVDKTKHWEIGVGMSKDGTVGLVGFPIKGNVGGWVAGNEDYVMGGITLKF